MTRVIELRTRFSNNYEWAAIEIGVHVYKKTEGDLESSELYGGELAVRRQSPEELLVSLRALVEHAHIECGHEQVVRRGDRVDVASEMQVELLYRDHLQSRISGGT